MRAVHVLFLNVLFLATLYVAVQSGFGVTVYENAPPAPQVAAAVTTVPNEQKQDPLLSEINAERIERGLPLLIPKIDVLDVATRRNNDMIANQYYAHTSPSTGENFPSYFEQLPAESCENLQLDTSNSASSIVTAWLQSTSGHRECLLNQNLRYIGFETRLFTDLETEYGAEPTYITTAILTSN